MCVYLLKYHISSLATRANDKPSSVRKHWEVYWELLVKLYWFLPRATTSGVKIQQQCLPNQTEEILSVCGDIQAYKASALSALSLLLLFKLYEGKDEEGG